MVFGKMTGQRLLIFDMDGVLVDVTESYRQTIIETVKQFTGRDKIGRASCRERV